MGSLKPVKMYFIHEIHGNMPCEKKNIISKRLVGSKFGSCFQEMYSLEKCGWGNFFVGKENDREDNKSSAIKESSRLICISPTTQGIW